MFSRASEQAERLQDEDPAEDREARENRRVDDAVAGEVGITAHLLCHGVTGNGARRREDGHERDEFDAAEAHEDGQAQHDGRHDDEPAAVANARGSFPP